MNLLLVKDSELSAPYIAQISGYRAHHLRSVLDVELGDTIKAGIINGMMGCAEITNISKSDQIELKFNEASMVSSPHPPPCRVILAMPRPKMMRRVLQNLSSMGIKEIHLIHSWRVEKSFWQTPWLKEEQLERQLILGLEQSMDTLLPKVHIHKRFKPFVEDTMPSIIDNSLALVAHPYTEQRCPVNLKQKSCLILGPEGGFTEYEIEKLNDAGVTPVSMGKRILRVETAIPALISRLYPG